MTTIVLRPKTVLVSAPSFISDVVYDGTDFGTATGYATLEGPLSLVVDIDNQLYTPVFFGITAETLSGLIHIADRTHIAFAPPRRRTTISAASVPQLAALLPGEVITKITITGYRFSDLVTVSGTAYTVSLRLSDPTDVTAPQEIIGLDRAVFDPAVHISWWVEGATLAANTNNTSFLDTGAINPPFRIKMKTIVMGAFPTPSFPGDVMIYGTVIRNYAQGNSIQEHIGQMFSRCDDFNQITLSPDIVMGPGDRLQLFGNNNNPANVYKAFGTFYGELMY